jgi:exosome complex component RRP4
MANPQEQTSREIVLPGEILSEGGHMPGAGTYRRGGKVYASMIGIRRMRGNVIELIPLSGKYVPQKGHSLIGQIMEVGSSFWVVDLNSPFVGILHVNDTVWKVGFGETAKYLETGAYVMCTVSEIEDGSKALITMKPPGSKKIDRGIVITVMASRVPRIIGKDGSMINMIKDSTRCQVYVGKNGRIWLEGPSDRVSLAIKAIRMVEHEAPSSGLTEKVSAFLRTNMPRAVDGKTDSIQAENR